MLVDEDVEPLGGGQLGGVLVFGSDDDALGVVRQVLDRVPPRIKMFAHLRDHLGVIPDDVFLLHGIGFKVVKFTVLKQSPTFPENRSLVGSHLGLGVRRRVI